MSHEYELSTELKWTQLPMPSVKRSDGSDAPKPKETGLPFQSAISVSGQLSQMYALLDALPADWRQIEMSFSPAKLGQGVTQPSHAWPEARFTLKGAVYATE